MQNHGRYFWLGAGVLAGVVGAMTYLGPGRTVEAANDRYEDYIMCTGTVTGTIPAHNGVASQTDGVWLLDYRSGKLLGTIIDRPHGKIVGWAELDMVKEFGIQPRQNVHFMMTTGSLSYGQAALYVAETTTGRFGVYTMGPRMDGAMGIMIRRHDLSTFRAPK